jgi:hypothetical protein
MIDNNFPLDIYKFNFKLMALEDMKLPIYKGPVFRGAFGITFRKAVCVTKGKNCFNRIISSQCSYFNIFETEVEQHDIPFLKGVKKTPHPFVMNWN